MNDILIFAKRYPKKNISIIIIFNIKDKYNRFTICGIILILKKKYIYIYMEYIFKEIYSLYYIFLY